MITFDRVAFAYKKKLVLENISFELPEGYGLFVNGESGCGKTTLLRLMMGLEKSHYGTINGLDGLKMSVVFQEDRLLPHKSILENVALFSDERTAEESLTALGLGNAMYSMPDELSGGMKRRTAIARAISRDFDILFLDEAMTGLDLDNVNRAVRVINRAAENKTVVVVTHSAVERELFADKRQFINLNIQNKAQL